MLKRKRKYREYLQSTSGNAALPRTTYQRYLANKIKTTNSCFEEPCTLESTLPAPSNIGLGLSSTVIDYTEHNEVRSISISDDDDDDSIMSQVSNVSDRLSINTFDTDSIMSQVSNDSDRLSINTYDTGNESGKAAYLTILSEFSDLSSNENSQSSSILKDDNVESILNKGASSDLNELLGDTKLTKFEVLLMIILYSFRHNLSKVATVDLIKLINVILGTTSKNGLAESNFVMSKIFSSNISFNYHLFCDSCTSYIGKKPERNIHNEYKCPSCKRDVMFASTDSGSPNFFLSISMKDQLKNIFENVNLQTKLDYRYENQSNSDVIKDIFDGLAYKKISAEGKVLNDRNNFSITFNTDGAPVFKSSKYSVWPIQFLLNELPPPERYSADNVMIAGLWFGQKEPQMNLFLRPFVEEAIDLANNGIDWININGDIINSKIVVMSCCVDSVAKPLVQCVKQFNGYFGCGYCKHPGTLVDGSQVRFTIVNGEVEVEDRTNESIREDMMEAFNTNSTVNGVKNISPLFPIPYFDLTFGFAIDYMHACLLGVIRTLAGLWFDSSNHTKQYYIGLDVARVDKKLSKIKPPSSISRNPRPITDRTHWKANEWRCWLLFYSLPCLTGILPRKYLNHLALLVTAVYTLLKKEVSHEEVDFSNMLLVEFVRQYQDLYGPHYMTINVHLLTHISKTVSLYGPLWVYSCFTFESFNGHILKLIQGTRGVSTQIVSKFLQQKSIPKCIQTFTVSEYVLGNCNKLFSCAHVKHFNQENDVTLLGKPVNIVLSDEDKALFCEQNVDITNAVFYRMIFNGIKYHCSLYKKPKKNNDCVIEFLFGSYGVIERILKTKANGVMILATLINVCNRNILPNADTRVSHLKVCSGNAFGTKMLIPVSQIKEKCLFLQVADNEMYLSNFPNLFEKD